MKTVRKWQETLDNVSKALLSEVAVESMQYLEVKTGLENLHTLSNEKFKIFSCSHCYNSSNCFDYLMANFYNHKENSYFITLWKYCHSDNTSVVIFKKVIPTPLSFFTFVPEQKLIIGMCFKNKVLREKIVKFCSFIASHKSASKHCLSLVEVENVILHLVVYEVQ